MGRTIAIGDIHGCADEFRALLDRLAIGPEDELVLLGDLVDRGPESGQVVREAVLLHQRLGPRLTVLRGNHEHKHLRFEEHARLPPTRRRNPVRFDDHLTAVHTQVGDEGWQWLARHTVLFRRVARGLLAVHAGVLPSVRHWPQREAEVLEMTPEDQKRLVTSALYVRDVDARGRFVPLGEQLPGQRFWGDAYNGRFGHVVHGHSPTRGPIRSHRFSTGVDTGCAFGGALTAVVWHGDVHEARPPDDVVQEPARGVYAPWRGEE
jgi:serine/threonine protein phosphatase 1